MKKFSEYLIRAIASVAAHGIAVVKNKSVRNEALKKLARGVLGAAATTALVEGALYELDKKKLPERSDDTLATDLRAAGVNPEVPFDDDTWAAAQVVFKRHGVSDEALKRFQEAIDMEKKIDASAAGSARLALPAPSAVTGVPVALDEKERVVEAIKFIAQKVGINASYVPEFVAAIKLVANTSDDVLNEISAITRMVRGGF